MRTQAVQGEVARVEGAGLLILCQTGASFALADVTARQAHILPVPLSGANLGSLWPLQQLRLRLPLAPEATEHGECNANAQISLP